MAPSSPHMPCVTYVPPAESVVGVDDRHDGLSCPALAQAPRQDIHEQQAHERHTEDAPDEVRGDDEGHAARPPCGVDRKEDESGWG